MPLTMQFSFEFICDLDLYIEEKPYHCALFDADRGHDVEYTNIQTEWVHDVEVSDVRKKEVNLSLKSHGFQYITHETKLGTRFDEEEFRHDIEEMTHFVQNELQAEHAIHYDFRIRDPKNVHVGQRNRTTESPATPTKAATLVHTDHSRDGGLQFVPAHMNPEEKMKYLSDEYYYQIVNIWKPLIEVIEDNPLGILDPASIHPSDLLEADNITSEWMGEMYLVKYNPCQRWWYLSQQKKNETWLFIAFDSRIKERLNCEWAYVQSHHWVPDLRLITKSALMHHLSINPLRPMRHPGRVLRCESLYSFADETTPLEFLKAGNEQCGS